MRRGGPPLRLLGGPLPQQSTLEGKKMKRLSVVLVRVAALIMVAGFTGSAFAQRTPASEQIPANLAPPACSVLVFELGARGVQIYTCAAKPDDATAFVWTFKAPEADLFNRRGEVVGYHFAGPTWQG